MRLAQSETYYPRFQEPGTGVTGVEVGILRVSDSKWWDFDDSTWQASPTTQHSALAEKATGIWTLAAGWAVPDAAATYAVQFKVTDASGDFYAEGPDIVVDDALHKIQASGGTIVKGTVSHDNTAASTTVFYCDDITEATADHYNGRIVIFTSGVLIYQATDITDYELDTGEGKFTVTALTEAPGDNDSFVII